jgi:hypothetical protein
LQDYSLSGTTALAVTRATLGKGVQI